MPRKFDAGVDYFAARAREAQSEQDQIVAAAKAAADVPKKGDDERLVTRYYKLDEDVARWLTVTVLEAKLAGKRTSKAEVARGALDAYIESRRWETPLSWRHTGGEACMLRLTESQVKWLDDELLRRERAGHRSTLSNIVEEALELARLGEIDCRREDVSDK